MKLPSIQYNSPVILTFAIICTLVFGVNYATATEFLDNGDPNLSSGLLGGMFSLGSSFGGPGNWPSLILYIFGHGTTKIAGFAGGQWLHFAVFRMRVG